MSRPTEVKLLAKMMDPTVSDDALALARDMIDALDESRVERDQWIVAARTMTDGPVISLGPYSTKNQAMKAATKLVAANAGEGIGAYILKMRQPQWIDKH